MIRIQKQRLLRFGAYKHLVLDYDQETTLIGGPNGSGKSQTLEALRLAFGNKDLQRPSSLYEYYVKKEVPQRSAATVTLSNRNEKGQADIFRRIGLRSESITMGVVYEPKRDGKSPKYGIHEGDLDMKGFVDATIQKPLNEKEFRAKLKTTGLTPAVIKHLFVQQGAAGELARKKPRELYQLVLDQGGYTEVKQEYEAALEESRRTQRQLEDRRRQEKTAKLDLREAQSDVRLLEDYLSQERALKDADWEERVRSMWVKRERRDKHAAELEDARQTLKSLPQDIQALAAEIGPKETEREDKERTRKNYDVELGEARSALGNARDTRDEARATHETAVAAHAEWLAVQSAPHVDDAQEAYEEVSGRLHDATALWQELKNDQAALKQQLEAIENNHLVVPEAPREVLNALRDEGIEARTLAEAVGPQSGMMESALQGFLWSIVCKEADLDKVKAISRTVGSTLPIVADSNKFWSAWRVTRDAVETPFGVIVTPQPEQERLLLERSPTTIQNLQRRIAALRVGIQDASETKVTVDAEVQNVVKVLEQAQTKVRLGVLAPDKDTPGKRMAEATKTYEECKERVAYFDAHPPSVLHGEIEVLVDELDRLTTKLTALQVKQEQMEQIVQEAPELIKEFDASLAEIDSWDAVYKAHVKDAEFKPRPQHLIERDRKHAKAYLESHERPGDDVRQKEQQLASRLDYLGQEIASITASHEANVAAVEMAKRKYGQLANDKLAEFKKRFEAVSERFHVIPRVEYTRIKEGMSDDAIQDAVLNITIQFGDKPPMHLQGGLSGGEGAVAGILLRLCMIDADMSGFFVVDEPYQALDASNVRLIADFLSESPYQILLVVPTSDDPNQYRGALRAFRMRPFGKGWAPAPDRLGIKQREVVEVTANAA